MQCVDEWTSDAALSSCFEEIRSVLQTPRVDVAFRSWAMVPDVALELWEQVGPNARTRGFDAQAEKILSEGRRFAGRLRAARQRLAASFAERGLDDAGRRYAKEVLRIMVPAYVRQLIVVGAAHQLLLGERLVYATAADVYRLPSRRRLVAPVEPVPPPRDLSRPWRGREIARGIGRRLGTDEPPALFEMLAKVAPCIEVVDEFQEANRTEGVLESFADRLAAMADTAARTLPQPMIFREDLLFVSPLPRHAYLKMTDRLRRAFARSLVDGLLVGRALDER